MASKSRDGDEQQSMVDARWRLVRQAEAVLHPWVEGAPPPDSLRRLQKVARGAPALATFWVKGPHVLPGRLALDVWLEDFRLQMKRVASQVRQERRDAWHQWVTRCYQSKPGRLYRWLRGPKEALPGLVPFGEPAAGGPPLHWKASFVGGPVAELRALQDAWRALWQKPATAGTSEAGWFRHYEALPAWPEWVPWDLEAVRAAVQRQAPGKAVGLDGWHAAELKLPPLASARRHL